MSDPKGGFACRRRRRAGCALAEPAAGAFSQVAGALGGFAEVLAAAQRQMAGVRADAEQAFRSLADAHAQHDQLRPPDAEQVQADPQAQTAYDQLSRDLDNRIGRLESDVDGQLAVAAGIHGRVLEAARQAGRTIRNAQRLADSREALTRAEQARAGLPRTREFRKKATAADGRPTLSGWKQPQPDGFTRATPEAVRDHAQRIGHDLTPDPARDQTWRQGSDGWSGKYQASHAEKQQALTAPDHPIGVSKPMCPDCVEFFRRHAIHTGQPQLVTDPDSTRLFHPDGRIIPNPGPKDFGPAPPTPPRPPDGLDREGAMVGAAEGATVGWNLPGPKDR